jgi:hypothetical protein
MRNSQKKIITYFLVLSLNNIGYSAEAEYFKVDLTNQLKNEASTKVKNGDEKFEIGLKLLKSIRELDNIDPRNMFDYKVISTEHKNNKLIIDYSISIKDDVLEKYSSNLPIIKIINKSAILNQYSNESSLENINEEDHSTIVRIGYTKIVEIIGNPIGIKLADRNGKVLLHQPTASAVTSKLIDLLINSFANKNPQRITKINLQAEIPITTQDAIRIDRIIFENYPHPDNVNGMKYMKSIKLIRTNLYEMINNFSKGELISYEIARENLHRSMIAAALQAYNMFSNESKETQSIYFGTLIGYLEQADIIDHLVLYKLFKNQNNTETLAFISGYEPIFNNENGIFFKIKNWKNSYTYKYPEKYPEEIQKGCKKYLPKNYLYANPASNFGANYGNEINELMSDIGMVNDTSVLERPDGKIRIITGVVSSLTSNGGIIYSNEEKGNSRPIQYTNNQKTVVLNPINIDKSIVRIVGTYDRNSKIQLKNSFGATRLVDSANITAICIESIFSENDLLQFLVKPNN